MQVVKSVLCMTKNTLNTDLIKIFKKIVKNIARIL